MNPTTGSLGCCACAANGHTAAPPRRVTKSRRIIASPGSRHADFGFQLRQSKQEIAPGEMGIKGQFALQKSRAANGRDGIISSVSRPLLGLWHVCSGQDSYQKLCSAAKRSKCQQQKYNW